MEPDVLVVGERLEELGRRGLLAGELRIALAELPVGDADAPAGAPRGSESCMRTVEDDPPVVAQIVERHQ
jgi:hypothetical protein